MKIEKRSVKKQEKELAKVLKAFNIEWTPSIIERPITKPEERKLVKAFFNLEIDLGWIIDDHERHLAYGYETGHDYRGRARVTIDFIREYYPSFPTFQTFMSLPVDQWPTVNDEGQIVPQTKQEEMV